MLNSSHKLVLFWGMFFSGAIVTIGLFILMFNPQYGRGILPAYYLGLVAHIIFIIIGTKLLKTIFPNFPVFLHPVVIFTGYFIVTVFLPATIGVIQNPSSPVPNLLTHIDYNFTGWNMALHLLAHACLWFGYLLGLNTFSLNIKEQELPADYVNLMVVFLFIVATYFTVGAIAGFGYGHDTNVFSMTANITNTLVNVDKLLLVIALFQVRRRAWPAWIAILILTFELTKAILSGFSGQTLLLLIYLGLCLYAIGIPFRKRIVLFAIVSIYFFFFFALPFQEMRRTTLKGNVSVKNVVDLLVNHEGFSSTTVAEQIERKGIHRQVRIIFTPNILLKVVPERIPYRGSESLLTIPLNALPRFLWPDKPVLSYGKWVNDVIFREPSTGSSSAISMVGDPYLYAGWPGIIVMYTAFGLLLSFICRYSVRRLPFLIGLFVIYYEAGELSVKMVGLIQHIAVFATVYVFLTMNSGGLFRPKQLPRETGGICEKK